MGQLYMSSALRDEQQMSLLHNIWRSVSPLEGRILYESVYGEGKKKKCLLLIKLKPLAAPESFIFR